MFFKKKINSNFQRFYLNKIFFVIRLSIIFTMIFFYYQKVSYKNFVICFVFSVFFSLLNDLCVSFIEKLNFLKIRDYLLLNIEIKVFILCSIGIVPGSSYNNNIIIFFMFFQNIFEFLFQNKIEKNFRIFILFAFYFFQFFFNFALFRSNFMKFILFLLLLNFYTFVQMIVR